MYVYDNTIYFVFCKLNDNHYAFVFLFFEAADALLIAALFFEGLAFCLISLSFFKSRLSLPSSSSSSAGVATLSASTTSSKSGVLRAPPPVPVLVPAL